MAGPAGSWRSQPGARGPGWPCGTDFQETSKAEVGQLANVASSTVATRDFEIKGKMGINFVGMQ